MKIESKKGYVYSLIVLITLISLLIFSYMAVKGELNIKNSQGEERKIGDAQTALLETIQKAESARTYIDQAAKYSMRQSFEEYNDQGGEWQEGIDGADNVFSVKQTNCSKFVYNRWSTQQQFCEPQTEFNTFSKFLQTDMKSYLAKYPDPAVNIPLNNYEFKVKKKGEEYVIEGTAQKPITVQVQKGVGRPRIAGPTVQNISIQDEDLALPVTAQDSAVTSCYGQRQHGDGFHDGIDFGNRGGETIKSIASGEVIDVCKQQTCSLYNCGPKGCQPNPDCERKCNGYGNYVYIKHDNGLHTRYAHLETVNVDVGDKVNKEQQIGTMGNTGASSAEHLHFGIYTSQNQQTGRNPFCFYSENQLESLQSQTSPTANNCLNLYGGGTVDTISYDKESISQCSGVGTSEQGQLNQGYFNKGSNYTVMPHFKVKTDLELPGITKHMQSVITWARNTWEETYESPQATLKEKIRQYNSENNSYKLYNDVSQCEQYDFFYKVVEEFETCLANDRARCVCRLNLTEIDDPKNYEIKLEGQKIKMEEPVKRVYDLETNTTYYNPQPADTNEKLDSITITKEGNNIEIESSQLSGDYKSLNLYKPENNKDKLVLTKVAGGISGQGQNQQAIGLCPENRRTFLVCAESRKEYKIQENGNTVKKPIRSKFALTLRDEKPKQEDVNVNMEQVEKSNQDLFSQVQEQVVTQGLSLALGIPPSILEMLPNQQKAALQVQLDVPETSDISAFQVQCSLNTPAGDIDVGSENSVVSVDNQYLNDLQSDVQRAEQNLESEVDMIQKLTEIKDKACEYMKVIGENGNVHFARKIPTRKIQDKTSFIMNTCGNEFMNQLAQMTSPSYCLTLIPMDSNGQRGEPIQACEKFVSIEKRMLEFLGLGEIKDSYVKITQNADDFINAVESGNPAKAIQVIGDSEIAKQVGETRLSEELSDNVVTNAIRDVENEFNSEEFRNNIQQVVRTAEEKSKTYQDLVQDREIPEEWKRKARHKLSNVTKLEDKKNFVRKTSRQVSELSESSQELILKAAKQTVTELSVERKAEMLKKGRRVSINLDQRINYLHETNLEFNAEAGEEEMRELVTDLQLTREQIDKLVRDVIDGKYGVQVQEIMLEQVMPEVDSQRIEQVYEKLHQLDEDQIVQLVNEEINSLSADAKARAMDEMMKVMPKDVLTQVVSLWDAQTRQRVLQQLYSQKTQQVKNIIQGRLEGIFSSLQCPANPLENAEMSENSAS